MISRKELRARLNLPTRRVKPGQLEVFESHNFKAGFGNWGDHISGEIVAHFSGTTPPICTDQLVAGKTLVVGSVMSHAMPGDCVWGAGCIAPGKTGHSRGELDVRAVRGPLTLEELRKRFDVSSIPFGDPALLMSQMHTLPANQITHEYGLIPHWIDSGLAVVERLKTLGVKVIDIRQPTQSLILELASVKKILSSSLHGLILSDALGIPNARVRLSSNVIGGDFKFIDYCLSVGREHSSTSLNDESTVSRLDQIKFNDQIRWNADLILSNAPWNHE